MILDKNAWVNKDGNRIYIEVEEEKVPGVDYPHTYNSYRNRVMANLSVESLQQLDRVGKLLQPMLTGGRWDSKALLPSDVSLLFIALSKMTDTEIVELVQEKLGKENV